jgi:hypothetical protein
MSTYACVFAPPRHQRCHCHHAPHAAAMFKEMRYE